VNPETGVWLDAAGANPGLASRLAAGVDFPSYDVAELLDIQYV
jgi:hypothetical protein